jgi:hypothetical protein
MFWQLFVWRRFVLLGLVALLLGGGGCRGDAPAKRHDEPQKYPDQSSPGACLTILKKTYTERNDIDEYGRLFTPDYTFVFSPNDATGPNPTPAQWSLPEELESTGNMFGSQSLTAVSLSFVAGDPVQSNLFPGTWKVELTSIELRLETRKADGSPLTVLVTNGHCAFYFKEFPGELTPSGPVWRIWRWEDQGLNPTVLAAVGLGMGREHKSWGSIKNLYLYGPR